MAGIRIATEVGGIAVEELREAEMVRTRGGIAFIAALNVSDAAGRRALALSDAELAAGFYPPEPGGIWTDGDAQLNLAGPCSLEITLGGGLPFPNRRTGRVRAASGVAV